MLALSSSDGVTVPRIRQLSIRAMPLNSRYTVTFGLFMADVPAIFGLA
jgi:hypothetical protein